MSQESITPPSRAGNIFDQEIILNYLKEKLDLKESV